MTRCKICISPLVQRRAQWNWRSSCGTRRRYGMRQAVGASTICSYLLTGDVDQEKMALCANPIIETIISPYRRLYGYNNVLPRYSLDIYSHWRCLIPIYAKVEDRVPFWHSPTSHLLPVLLNWKTNLASCWSQIGAIKNHSYVPFEQVEIQKVFLCIGCFKIKNVLRIPYNQLKIFIIYPHRFINWIIFNVIKSYIFILQSAIQRDFISIIN